MASLVSLNVPRTCYPYDVGIGPETISPRHRHHLPRILFRHRASVSEMDPPVTSFYSALLVVPVRRANTLPV